jgi:hypothetical protein
MSCGLENHKYALDQIVGGFRTLETDVNQYLGLPWLGSLLIAAAVLPIAVLFVRSQVILVPWFVNWWYNESIEEKALAWWRKYRLNWLGFRHSTAIIAISAGFAFYVATRVVIAFPGHWRYTLPTATALFIGIAVLGFFVSGNVPEGDAARREYFKRFQSPSVTGFGLAMAGFAIDLAINTAAAVVSSFV